MAKHGIRFYQLLFDRKLPNIYNYDVDFEWGDEWECIPYISLPSNQEDIEMSFTITIPIEGNKEMTRQFMEESAKIHGFNPDDYDDDMFSFLHEIGHTQTLTVEEALNNTFGIRSEDYYNLPEEVKATKWALDNYDFVTE